jgi:hypothetical protein
MRKLGTLSIWLDDQTVMSWFAARASHNTEPVLNRQKEIGRELVAKVKKDLVGLGFSGIQIAWSQYAGCSCGCSPGYAIRVDNHHRSSARVIELLEKKEGASYALEINYFFQAGKLKRRINMSSEWAKQWAVELSHLLGISQMEYVPLD